MAAASYLLFESALGYALFTVEEAEVIGIEIDTVQSAILDLAKFGKICKLKAFVPFRSAQDALENINNVSEGLVTDLLKTFLEANLPKGKALKKSDSKLGVGHHAIGSAIADALDIPCAHGHIVAELLRGVRLHFAKMIKSLSETANVERAQLGLGHSYSRGKVKFNVHRADNMIIQAINILDQIDKDVNTFSMRCKLAGGAFFYLSLAMLFVLFVLMALPSNAVHWVMFRAVCREWYGYHFPELVRIVGDNFLYARLVQLIKRRSSLTDDSLAAVEEILMNSAQAQQVLDAAKSSMGMEISDIDLLNINAFAARVTSLANYRKSLHEYLTKRMNAVAPNLSGLIGEQVGARLIAHAGSLTNLAKAPASTVQILGAEKALFRALKTKGNTPKYGLIFHSTFIGRAAAKNKGRISRFLANKASIASRIDCFTDAPTDKFGVELKKQVEERLAFYETGEAPRKNLDVMHSVIALLGDAAGAAVAPPSDDKKKKKDKKRKSDVMDTDVAPVEAAESKKKKKAAKEQK